MGGAVHQLGTRAHHERFLRKIATLELPGAFAMTEAGHGSDVQHLETTATWDPETKELVVHTPSDEARKEYVGNAARDGRMAVVFAQLDVAGESHGLHALIVPLREENGEACDGVRIEDCGEKLSEQFGGLNPAEMVTFVAGQVVENVVERLFARKIVQVIADAIPTPGEDSGNLLDREYQLELFRWREGHIVARRSQSLQARAR